MKLQLHVHRAHEFINTKEKEKTIDSIVCSFVQNLDRQRERTECFDTLLQIISS